MATTNPTTTAARETTINGKLLLGVLDKSNLPPSQKAYLVSLVPPEKTFSASEDSERK